MATPARAILNTALLPDGQNTWLRELVEKELESKSEHLGIDDLHPSGCLLEDVGVLLVKTASMLSEVAVSLAEGQHIKDYSGLRIEQIEQENDFSELDVFDYLDAKHSSLRSLAAHFQNTTEAAKRLWQDSPDSPFGDLEAQQHYNDIDRAPASMASGEQLLSMLDSRGKGQWVCSEGNACTKGGVRPDGILVVFERNSSFKAHMQKHEKRFKCPLPGCNNKTGFARKDQLERHKQIVKHGENN